MNIDKDLEILLNQESLLAFKSFDESTAASLGQAVIAMAEKLNKTVTVLVRLSGSPVFVQAMPGTAPANFHWANRKANLVELYGQSSYRLGINDKKSGESVVQVAGLDPHNFTAHGGSFPIRVESVGLVGSVTVSGLPQREDHILVTNVIAQFLGVKIEQLD